MLICSKRVVSNVLIASGLGVVFWVLGLICFAAFVCYSHEKAKTFEHKHLYRPLSGSYRQVALHARGDIEAGGDNVVSKSLILITITTNDGKSFARALQFSFDNLLVGDASYVRVSATPEALAAWLGTLPIENQPETLPAEIAELSELVSDTCHAYGPMTNLQHFAWIEPE